MIIHTCPPEISQLISLLHSQSMELRPQHQEYSVFLATHLPLLDLLVCEKPSQGCHTQLPDWWIPSLSITRFTCLRVLTIFVPARSCSSLAPICLAVLLTKITIHTSFLSHDSAPWLLNARTSFAIQSSRSKPCLGRLLLHETHQRIIVSLENINRRCLLRACLARWKVGTSQGIRRLQASYQPISLVCLYVPSMLLSKALISSIKYLIHRHEITDNALICRLFRSFSERMLWSER